MSQGNDLEDSAKKRAATDNLFGLESLNPAESHYRDTSSVVDWSKNLRGKSAPVSSGGSSLQTAEALVFMWQAFGLGRLFVLIGRLAWFLVRNVFTIAAWAVLAFLAVNLVLLFASKQPITQGVIVGCAAALGVAGLLFFLGQFVRLLGRIASRRRA